jgi:hypothetical protein
MSTSQPDITVDAIGTRQLSGLIVEFNIARRNSRSYPPGHPLVESSLEMLVARYPTVSSGWQLNLCSHMTMISDFFDALRTRRPFREPMDLQSISGMMLDMMGTGFHPALARNFLHIIRHLQNELRSSG